MLDPKCEFCAGKPACTFVIWGWKTSDRNRILGATSSGNRLWNLSWARNIPPSCWLIGWPITVTDQVNGLSSSNSISNDESYTPDARIWSNYIHGIWISNSGRRQVKSLSTHLASQIAWSECLALQPFLRLAMSNGKQFRTVHTEKSGPHLIHLLGSFRRASWMASRRFRISAYWNDPKWMTSVWEGRCGGLSNM